MHYILLPALFRCLLPMHAAITAREATATRGPHSAGVATAGAAIVTIAAAAAAAQSDTTASAVDRLVATSLLQTPLLHSQPMPATGPVHKAHLCARQYLCMVTHASTCA